MNIAVTWPKTQPLHAYLHELKVAAERSEVINYRVTMRPKAVKSGDRCYMVYDGYIRGWNIVIDVLERQDGQVKNVRHGGHWPGGIYIVREPIWHPLEEKIPMKSFRGFRYVTF